MKTTTSPLPKSEIKIIIELESAEMQKYYEKALQRLGKELSFPGFRPGFIPPEVVKSKMGAEIIQSTMAEIAIPVTYADAVIEQKIKVVAKPKINVVSYEPLKYEAIVAILPDIKFKKDPKGIKIAKNKITVTDQDQERFMKDIVKSYAQFTESKEPAKRGDRIELNFEGFDEQGNVLEGMKSVNHPLILGDKIFLDDFEEKLVGMKSGEKQEFDIVFPKDYHKKNLQNKKVHFKVEAVKIENVGYPELNAEFLEKKLGIKKTVDEFKVDVKKSIENFKNSEEKSRRENEFLNELLKFCEIEIPEALIADEVDFMINEVKISLKKKGLPEKQIEEYLKPKIEELQKKYRSSAEKQITLRRALNSLLEKEKIEITEEDLKKEIEEIKKNYPATEHAKIEEEYKGNNDSSIQLQNRLKMEKLFNIYLD